MSSLFEAEQNFSNKTTETEGPKRAADFLVNRSELQRTVDRSTRAATTSKAVEAPRYEANYQPKVMNHSPVDRVVNLEGRTKSFMYIPVSLGDADEVWTRVVNAIRCMENADFNEVGGSGEDGSYDCYSLKYMYDSFVLARTRLVRLEESEDQIFIELRKLEGDGFAFTDDFQRHLETSLADITVPDERPEPQAKPEAMFLDLSDEVTREEILSNWFTNLRPTSAGNTLVYNEIETFKAISSLGWNTTSPENFEILQAYGSDIVESSLNVLAATAHLPTAYFAALTLNEFAKNGQMEADWGHIKMMSGAVINWSDSETGGEFAKMQVSRSREVVRLLSNVIIAVAPQLTEEGKAKAKGNVDSMLETLQELSNSEDYEGCFDVDALATALSM